MTDLSWLDEIQGLENAGSQNEQIEGFQRFKGLSVCSFSGRNGAYKINDEEKPKLFGAILAFSEVRTLFVGMSTPPEWEIELARHNLPEGTPLCTWEGGNHSPRVNTSLERSHQEVVSSYGAGSACRVCTLGSWKRNGGKPVKPACPAKAAILFLPLNDKEFAEEPIVVTVSNYRSVNNVLGTYSKENPIPGLQAEADQYGVSEFGRMVPILALKAQLKSDTFDTKNGKFHFLDFSFHGLFDRPQVAQAAAVLMAHNVFKADPEAKALLSSGPAPALTGATVAQGEFVADSEEDSIPF